MAVGPVEYLVVAFPGSRFRGDLLPELKRLVDGGVIHILDLTFVKRDDDGVVSFLELDSLDAEEAAMFADIDGEVGGLLSEEDLAVMAEEIPAGSSAALLVWENTWAAPMTAAVRAAGGVVVAHERVPEALVELDLQAIAREGALS
ncbi:MULTISPECIES: DUF6325 family protein [Streptacidiphilus]|uniref:DUF6325 family protein n=1 Tax=Streptacidiphilus cavernicola TaxID=3342716 RepID=A0ABV6UJ47_9ACTN|nr:DUF6325 family protein [Streptacidiphilus jeojiense]